MKILTACVRSRLVYSVQAWELSGTELQKIGVVWNGFLRKMIAGGYARKNTPPQSQRKKGIDPATQVKGELDWAFKISNTRLHEITNTQPIQDFCHIQYLKYIAHVSRMKNDAIQKQVLFDKRKTWKKLEDLLGIDSQQALRSMMNKRTSRGCWSVGSLAPSNHAPRPITRRAGNIDDVDDYVTNHLEVKKKILIMGKNILNN
jgi:hypothetical protein